MIYRVKARRLSAITAVAMVLFASGIAVAGDQQKVIRLSEPVEQTPGYETFGSLPDESASAVSLTEIVKHGDRFAGQTVRVDAKVAEVCQKKGCFFIAREGDAVVRVSFRDYAFFVPTDIGGKRIMLVGEVVARDVTPDEATHYAEDLGNPAAPVKPGKTYEIVATSVRVPRAP